MSNKTVGNQFEKEFCEMLGRNGFWVHNFQQNKDGQPADVIVVKGDRTWLIDCKVCENDRFSLSRIEPNQHTAMRYWERVTAYCGYFALKTSDGIYIIPYSTFGYLTKASLSLDEIRQYGMEVEEWIQSW